MAGSLRNLPLVLLLAALLALTALPATAEETEDGKAGDEPATLEELAALLDRLAERLGELVELAAKDARFRWVEAYLAYDEEDFKNRKREYKAKDMVDIIVDPEAPIDLRTEARDALTSEDARSLDPDLVVKKGQTKPRNDFCRTYLVKYVKDDDGPTRKLVHELLLSLFPRAKIDSALGVFDPMRANRAQRRKAAAAWHKHLRK